MIQYILNVIIVCCALILPGMAVAHGFFRKSVSKWNMPFRIVFVVVYSLLTPKLYGRHALFMSPPLFLAFFLAFSHICTKTYHFIQASLMYENIEKS